MADRLTVEAHVKATAGDDLAAVFGAVASAAAKIAAKIRLAGLSGDTLGAAGATNVQGEQQQKLDVYANHVLTDALREVSCVAALVSEEDDEPVDFARGLFSDAEAKFVLAFDPLDGSSNIDVNVNVGTILSVQQRESGSAAVAAALHPGSRQVAACYVVYGPSTVMVMTAGRGVASFTLDDSGSFRLSAEDMQMPPQGPYYSTNEANASTWPQPYRDFIAALLAGKLNGKAYSSRYIGSLVADFHRTLLKGGVFLYPPTAKAPRGKLRLLYEANPLALIAEAAGGAAIDGRRRILEVKPEQIHERTSLVVGSRAEVELLQKLVAETEG